MSVITYDELAAGLEDAWLLASLHDHLLAESVLPDTLERVYRVELFPEHPEPLTEGVSPPWVELSFTWTPAHQLHSDGRELSPACWSWPGPTRSMCAPRVIEAILS